MLKLAENCKMYFACVVKSDITVVHAAVVHLCCTYSQFACCIIKRHVIFEVTLHSAIEHNPLVTIILILPPSDTRVLHIHRTLQLYVLTFCRRHVY